MAIRKSITALAALLVLTCLLLITTSTPNTAELLADDIPLEGHVACQTCLHEADNEWGNCIVSEAGGDVGDADCRSRYNIAVSSCQTAYCNQTASRPESNVHTLDLLIPTAEAAACDILNAMRDCEWKAGDRYHSCLITSGSSVSTEDCLRDRQRYYTGCMTAWGCPSVPTSGPGDN